MKISIREEFAQERLRKKAEAWTDKEMEKDIPSYIRIIIKPRVI